MRRSLVLLAALALAACSQSEPSPSPDASGSAQATAAEARATTPADVVPAAFRGVWDYVKGTCDPASDLRIEVKERAIEFYESHGDISRLSVESPESIVLDLAMEGEGEQWSIRRRFTLSDDGQTLTPRELGEEQFEPMPLKRCP